MTNENDTILVKELIESYRGQFDRYCSLRNLTRELMGRLVLRRGDLSAVFDTLRKKQVLLEAVEAERTRIAGRVTEWQKRKNEIAPCEATYMLNDILNKVADVIREFLDDEFQVRRYIENVSARKTVQPSSFPDDKRER